MFFLIDFSYKQELGIHTRLLPPVIPAQAGIQTLAFQEYFKAAATSNFWIPACAGMTAEVSAKLLLPFSDGLCLVGVHCSVGFAHDNVG